DGRVSSSPAGIDCGTGCSASFSTSSVNLVATPDGQSDFTSWSGGGCSGTGSCRVSIFGAGPTAATFTLRPAVFALSPAGVDFGAIALGAQSAAVDLVLTNTGGAPSTSPSFTFDDPQSFAVGGTTCSGPLAGGASCKVSVRFTPAGSA